MLHFLLSISDENSHEKIIHIFNKYHNYMMRYAVSRFESIGRSNFLNDAEDAVQNTFMKITRYIEKIDFSRGENDVKNYCLAILNNEICNVLSDEEPVFDFPGEFSLEKEYNIVEKLSIQENYAKVVSAIEDLDEKYSTTLYLVFCKEMTVNEIADMMGISTKTVYTRLERGKKLLLESLKGAVSNG